MEMSEGEYLKSIIDLHNFEAISGWSDMAQYAPWGTVMTNEFIGFILYLIQKK